MKKQLSLLSAAWLILLLINLASCVQEKRLPAEDAISQMNLKTGDVTWCGPPQQEFGSVEFTTSCSPAIKADFNIAMSLLHSFEYDEAEKVFAKIIKAEPNCAMAYWGVAMSNYHPLWAPPSQAELQKGSKAVSIAQALPEASAREAEYIDAIATFYQDWETKDHKTRSLAFEKAMEKIYLSHLEDREAAILYALALDASADPADKAFKNQKKAYRILNSLYPGQPDHPGIVHYIIHSYDYPELAAMALPAARKYASIAPSSAHAQHMPSHVFTRLGLWDESISSNLAATSSAKCYAENAGIKGHWDEELHGMDYLVYSYLQQGDNKMAKAQWDYLNTITEVNPVNFKVAYAYASIPSRYLLENKMWSDAAALELRPADFPWQKFPWQKAIVHFTKILGYANLNNITSAKSEYKLLSTLRDTLIKRGETYQAGQVQNQLRSSEAWISFKEGKNEPALKLMIAAAEMEDKTEKHPVTPGEVLPARELLGEMLLQMNRPAEALMAFEANLRKHPNRFNGLNGAAIAAERSNNFEKAKTYYTQLVTRSTEKRSDRPELLYAAAALKKDR
jgi:hypothetical protein